MRGGMIDDDGELSKEDFLIDVTIIDKIGNLMSNHGLRSTGYKVLKSDIDTKKIQPRLKRKNDIFDEPFIFFSPKIREDNLPHIVMERNDWLLFSKSVPTMYYEYVAFNEGRFSKTAKFKQVQININFERNLYSFPDVPISEIPQDALIQLRNFIIEQRTSHPTFCNTIYTAVEAELQRKQQNQ